MTQEKWLPIPGYEGIYSVSDQGRVRSEEREVASSNGAKRTVSKRILSSNPTKTGRVYVNLRESGEGRPRQVSSYVLEAFVGPRPEGKFVVHINGCTSDNRLSNLTYGSRWGASRNKKNVPEDALVCSRGHARHGDNLIMKPFRMTFRNVCVACSRMQDVKRGSGRVWDEVEEQVVSDRFYREIMEAA